VNIRLLLITGILVFGLAACSTMQVETDYDPGYDYSKLKTYNWVPNPSIKQGNELFEKHFQKIMGENLATKGITRDEANPDFLIAYHGDVQRRVDVTNWGYRYPGWYGGIDVYQYNEGTIVVDFIDAKSKELIYRSTVTAEVGRGSMDFEKRQKRITEAVEKILKDFPPGGKKK
jgi:hypothetical protein